MEGTPVRHILLGKFRPEMTPDQMDEVIRRFREMAHQIPGFLSFEHGVNNSNEGRSLGFNQAVIVTFSNADSREAYLVHPDHIQFSHWLGEQDLLQDLMIFDYEIQA